MSPRRRNIDLSKQRGGRESGNWSSAISLERVKKERGLSKRVEKKLLCRGELDVKKRA